LYVAAVVLDPRFCGDGEGDCGRNPTEHCVTMIYDSAINNIYYCGGPGVTRQGYTTSNITKLHLGLDPKKNSILVPRQKL